MNTINKYAPSLPKLLDKEWHLSMLDVGYAWKHKLYGKHINVCVTDSGVYYNPDLKIKNTAVNPIVKDAELIVKQEAYLHGTAVAGIIGGKGNKYMLGIAPKCNIISYTLIGPLAEKVSEVCTFEKFIYKNLNKIDIYNNSYGPEIASSPNTTDDSIIIAIEKASKKGRHGKGNIFVFSSGNENIDGGLASYNRVLNNRYTICVGSINSDFDNSTYSNIGLGLLCVAPGGKDLSLLTKVVRTSVFASFSEQGITTLLPNTHSLQKHGLIPYTHDFNGTSAACPMVSGCVALLLEKRPDLTWRDVKEILSRSCYQDYYVNLTVPREYMIFNGRNDIVSQWTGYGTINIQKMLKVAKSWKLLPCEKNTSNLVDVNVVLDKDNKTFIQKIKINKNICIETVQFYITLNSNPPQSTEYLFNIGAKITSPSGTILQLINDQSLYYGDPAFEIPQELQYYDNQPFLVELLRGEMSAGEWTIEFTWNSVDGLNDIFATLSGLKLDIYGH